MASPSPITVDFQEITQMPPDTANCIACGKSNWANHSAHFPFPYKGGDHYAHKGCIIICQLFDLTVQNIKFRSSFSQSFKTDRFVSIISKMNYINTHPSTPVSVLNRDHILKIRNEKPKNFNEFVQAVQRVYDEIVQSRSSSSSSSSDSDTVDSKTDDDADMAPASNSSSSPTDDSVQGYSDDDNDVDDLDSNNAFPAVTGSYGLDALG